MEVDLMSWDEIEQTRRQWGAEDPSLAALESFVRNMDQKDLIAPLREVQLGLGTAQPGTSLVEKRRAALELQEQWNTWLAQRDQLRADIKRGKEFLDQVERNLAGLRGRLEDWPAFERACGKNPLLEYAQRISAKEHIQKFLPGWIQRREEQLAEVTRKLTEFARQNGLEHLL